jgi:chromate transporter
MNTAVIGAQQNALPPAEEPMPPPAEVEPALPATTSTDAADGAPPPKDLEAPGIRRDGDPDVSYWTRLGEVATAFFPIGFIAFGGPQAHIALFLKLFVEEKKWLDEDRFMELMSLGQAMPGPTSTQVATAIGITRAGWLGGLVAFVLFDWVGFIVCIVVGSVIHATVEGDGADPRSVNIYREVVVGMGPAAISQVFLAAYALGGKATGGDPVKTFLAVATCLIALLVPSSFTAAFSYLGMMVMGG